MLEMGSGSLIEGDSATLVVLDSVEVGTREMLVANERG